MLGSAVALRIRHCVLVLVGAYCASAYSQTRDEARRCIEFAETSPKQAHLSTDCFLAAVQGHGPSQYAVGMSFGYAGERQQEEYWYRQSAANGVVAAYLALGHVLRGEPNNNLEEAVYWYTRFWEAGPQGRGYAAQLLSQIEAERGNKEEANVWLQRCRDSDYEGCKQ
jgi:TPR repeat protein